MDRLTNGWIYKHCTGLVLLEKYILAERWWWFEMEPTNGGFGKFAGSTSCGIVTHVSTQWLPFWDLRPASVPGNTLSRDAAMKANFSRLKAILDKCDFWEKWKEGVQLRTLTGDMLLFQHIHISALTNWVCSRGGERNIVTPETLQAKSRNAGTMAWRFKFPVFFPCFPSSASTLSGWVHLF
jgi:hypothetical protein